DLGFEVESVEEMKASLSAKS
ncbi:hypothetical protein, partial [Listeria monocytogenes]